MFINSFNIRNPLNISKNIFMKNNFLKTKIRKLTMFYSFTNLFSVWCNYSMAESLYLLWHSASCDPIQCVASGKLCPLTHKMIRMKKAVVS